MIRIRILSDKSSDKQNIRGFDIRGHAAYADRGEDIICAAISVLGQTAVLSLTDLTGLKVDYVIDEDLPLLSCKVKLPEDQDDRDGIRARAILDSFEIGCRSIAEGYGPDYVNIIFVSELF